jgi:hypothetical protein
MTRRSTLIALLPVLSLSTARSSFSLLSILLRLARKLNGNLSFKDLLARELRNGTFSLAGGGEVNESIAYRAVGARVLRDRGRFTARAQNVNKWCS